MILYVWPISKKLETLINKNCTFVYSFSLFCQKNDFIIIFLYFQIIKTYNKVKLMPAGALNLSLLLTNGRCLEKRSYYENETPVKWSLQAGLEGVVSPDLTQLFYLPLKQCGQTHHMWRMAFQCDECTLIFYN